MSCYLQDKKSGQMRGSRPFETARNTAAIIGACGFLAFAGGSFALRPAQTVVPPHYPDAPAAQSAPSTPRCAPGTGAGTGVSCDHAAYPQAETAPRADPEAFPQAETGPKSSRGRQR